MRIPEREELLELFHKNRTAKKSLELAKALAKDWEAFSGSTAVGLVGEKGRINRVTGLAEPGAFVRTIVYETCWYDFPRKEDALKFREIKNSSLNPDRHSFASNLIEKTKDFGMLEILNLLFERGSDLRHTREIFHAAVNGEKYKI